jgi:anti-sigma factor RsiW
MTCRELVELVTDYFDGALSVEDRARFEAHIADCALCTRYLEQMRVTIRTVGRIDEESLAPDVRATFLAAFSDWTAAGQPRLEPPV